MNYKEILKTLPHRYPFLLVDRVVEIKRVNQDPKSIVGDEIVAIKNVTFNEPHFQGHFPDDPIMPGVLITEAMAQASALVANKPHPTGGRWNFYMLGIDKARFRKPVVPGETLELKCKCIKQKSGFMTFECQAWVDKELKAEAEIFAQMVP